MFSGILIWLDATPARLSLAAWAVFALTAAAALPRGVPRRLRHPALFAALAMISILAFRWPVVCDNREVSDPDESQMISGALTLRHDPLYWRSVDGQTRGPLDDWPLLGLLRATGRLDYIGARLTGAVLAWMCVMGAWLALRHLFGDPQARVLVLPLLAVHAFANFWNFIQYGSEHVPDALVAVASMLMLTAWNPSGRDARLSRLFAAGLLLGALPFAKLQAAPIAAWMIACGAWQLVVPGEGSPGIRLRRLAGFVAGILAFPFGLLLWVVSSGIWGDFYRSYIVDNIRYAAGRGFPWAQTPAKFLALCHAAPGVPPFLAGVMLFSLLAMAALPLLGRWHRRCILFALGLALASVYSAMAPGRMFQHYLQLVFFPSGLLAATLAGALGAAAQEGSAIALRRRVLVAVYAAYLACGLLPQAAWRAQQVQACQGSFSQTGGRLRQTEVDRVISKYAREGDCLGIWGWAPRYWVETQTAQATRDGNTNRQIEDSTAREYYRERYIADLLRSRPSVIVDAVGPGSFGYNDRASAGHEGFGALAVFMGAHYSLVCDTKGARIYVRNDRRTDAAQGGRPPG